MKVKFKQDLVGAICFLIVGLALWFLIPAQIKLTNQDTINSQTFPKLIIGLMILCSIYLIVVESVKMIRKQPVKEVMVDLKQEGKSIAVIMMLVVYWALLHWLPFMITSLLFAGVMLLFFKCKNWKYYAIVATTIVIVTIMFQNVLNVKLP